MNPFQHGEVFVTDDGAQTDLDLGHYERFTTLTLRKKSNFTTGQVYLQVIENEREGKYLGKTVQMIPHVTNTIKEHFLGIAEQENADIVVIELGGTVGDIEMMLFTEAARQLKKDVGPDNILYVLLTYVPELEGGEQKSKPTQQSTNRLREMGIQPDIIISRAKRELDKEVKEKISLFGNIDINNVISDPNAASVYEIPIIFENQGLKQIISNKLNLDNGYSLKDWKALINNLKHPSKEVNIAICGKYTRLSDSYLSILEALNHATANTGIKVNIKWIETTAIENNEISVEDSLMGIDGVIVPGGFGSRGTEGKIKVIKYVRENKIPFLGICLGFQLAVIEFARNALGLDKANSTEFAQTEVPVIDLLPEQIGIEQLGGTMRLGGHDVLILDNTKAFEIFKNSLIRRRFRHRYEVNPSYIEQLQSKELLFSGMTPDKKIMQVLELTDHPYFMAAQFHPEFTSRVERPSELFLNLVSKSFEQKKF